MSEKKDPAIEWAAQTISNHLVLEASLRNQLAAVAAMLLGCDADGELIGFDEDLVLEAINKLGDDNAAMRGALGACVRHIERERDQWVQDNSPDADEGTIDEDAAPHLAEIDSVLDSARAALRPADAGEGVG